MTGPVVKAITGKRGRPTVMRMRTPIQSRTSNDEWGYATRQMHDEICR
jgi:hypothetical protein